MGAVDFQSCIRLGQFIYKLMDRLILSDTHPPPVLSGSIRKKMSGGREFGDLRRPPRDIRQPGSLSHRPIPFWIEKIELWAVCNSGYNQLDSLFDNNFL